MQVTLPGATALPWESVGAFVLFLNSKVFKKLLPEGIRW